MLVKLIYYSLTEEEFEDGWKEMLETYKSVKTYTCK